MFEHGDADKFNMMNSSIPDGVIDASNFSDTLCKIVEYMSFLEPDRFDKGIMFMMNCINLCYEDNEDGTRSEFSQKKAEDAITALGQYVMELYLFLPEDSRSEFIRYQREESLPEAIEQCKALPFYDIEDDVNNILDVMDQISAGDFSNVKFISEDEASEYGINLEDEND